MPPNSQQLLELSIAIGSHQHLDELYADLLARLVHISGLECGMLLLQTTQPHNLRQGERQLQLAAMLGDPRLAPHQGNNLILPIALVDGPCALFSYGRLGQLPVRQSYYRSALRLPIPGHGLLLLLGPSLPEVDEFDVSTLAPLMSQLGNAINLCNHHQVYEQNLADDGQWSDSERLRHALDASRDLLLIADQQSLRIVDCNASARRLLNGSGRQLHGLPFEQLLAEDERDEFTRLLQQPSLLENGFTYVANLLRANGGPLPVVLRIDRTQADPPAICILARDETLRRRAEKVLIEEQERALVTLESIGDGVIATDRNGLITYMNPIAEQLSGYRLEQVRGKPLERALLLLDETNREPATNPVDQCLQEGRIVGLPNHTILVNRHGREVAIEDSAAPIRSHEGELIGVVMVFHDVSKARSMARELSWQATHDAMTGLLNRVEFEGRLDEALERAIADESRHAMLYLDLDQFKVVNDTCGHVAGDELLKQIGILLQRQVRTSDTLARLGGDEFGLLLTDCALEQAKRIADNIRQAISSYRFVWAENSFEIGVSIGLVEINDLYSDGSQVMSNADIACYAAKDLGRNRLHIYQPDDDELLRRHSEMLWVTRITNALEVDRLELYCQPIEPTVARDGPVDHYEVLVRLRDEDGRLVPPNAFIPAAERYKIMPAVDKWIIQRLFSTVSQYQQAGAGNAAPLQFSINLSGASINEEDTLEFIEKQLHEFGLNPALICFEITETTAISNLTRAHRLIRDMKRLGFEFALDDFGNGVSSFAYLKNLPIDYLKLDGSYVKEMLDDPIDDAMVAAINQIGHVMGLKTIAEYVENDAIRSRLAELQVDYVQGYAVGKPRPLCEELRLVAKERSLGAPEQCAKETPPSLFGNNVESP